MAREPEDEQMGKRLGDATADAREPLVGVCLDCGFRARESNAYRNLFEQGFSALAVTDLAGAIVECNAGFERLAGVGRGGTVGRYISSFARNESVLDFSLAVRKVGDECNSCFAFDASLIGAGGEPSRVEVKAVRLECEGAPPRIAFVMNDVTERVLAAKAVELALSEKIALLQEIRHRVGNNLQIIASLMRLTKSRYRDGVNFAEAVLARVEAMALLYQNMVEDKGVFNIHLGDFVEELMDEILDLYGFDRSAFAVETMLEEPDAIYGDRVIPFGLLMSEAARIFVEEGGTGGRLRMSLRRRDGALELEIASQERRLPRAYYDCGSDESLLLRVLAEQLKGELEFGDGSERGWTGTRIAIRIPA